MSSLLRRYNDALTERPMFVQSVTGAVLYAAGDILAQQAFEQNGMNHDILRTFRGTFYTGVVMGPAMTIWYRHLNNLRVGSKNRATVYKAMLDQFCVSPVALACFFISMAVLEGQPYAARERLEKTYIPTLIRSWTVFLPTQLINFSVVPPHLRLIVASVVSLFWNTYLSAINALSQGPIAILSDDVLLSETLPAVLLEEVAAATTTALSDTATATSDSDPEVWMQGVRIKKES